MTFSHELAQARLDWRYAYFKTSCARIYTPISLHLKSISLLRHHYATLKNLRPLRPPLRPLKNLPPLRPPQKKGSNGTYITTRPERGNVAVVKSFIFLNNWLHCWSWYF